MGKVIKRQIQGMSWLSKTGLVLLLTLATTIFTYNGWYKPLSVQAATVTYGVTVPSTASTGIDGAAQMPTGGASIATAPTVRGNMSTTFTTSGASYRPTSGMTSGTSVTLLKLYSPAYATAQTITAPSGSFAIRGYNSSDTWTFHIYSHNPAGTAGNKTLMYSSNTTTSGTQSTVTVVPTYTLVNSSMPAGYKLLVEVVYRPGGTTYTPRVYLDGTAASSWSRLTVTETAAATGDTLAASANTAIATSPQLATATNVLMQRFQVAASANTIELSSLTINDPGTATLINNVKVYIDTVSQATLPATAVLIGNQAAWNGASTAITLNQGTTANRTVTSGTPKYIYIVYDMNSGMATQTVQSQVTAVGVVTPDTGASGLALNSTAITLSAAPADTLTVGTNAPIATSASDSAAGVVMQRVALNSNANGDGQVILSSITIDDNAATATSYANARIYIDSTASTTLPATAVLIGSQASFTGASTTIPLAGGTTANRTVTTTTKYLYVVYDMASGQATKTAQSRITAVGVSAPDTGATGLTFASNSFTLAAAPVSTIQNCNGCHGYTTTFNDGTARNVPAGQFPGSHNNHVISGGTACSVCHVAPATTTSADFNHADGTVSIASPISGGTYGKASFPVSNAFTPSTCNTTTCHGAVSPAWGTNSASTVASCVKCHGVSGTTTTAFTTDPKTAAPGYMATGRDTGGATVATDTKVGAHDTHLRGLNTISSPVACTECHANVNNASSSFTGHMSGTGNLNFGTLAASGTGTAPSYNATTGSCTNTYCHYGRSATYAPPATANGAVVWNNTAYLTGVDTPAADCGKCHASPPLTTGSHAGVTSINQCNGCHNNVTATGTFTNPSLHINGIVESQGCSGCHGWPPTTSAHTVHINDIIAEKGLGSLPGGFVGNQVCGTCHNVSALTKHAGDAGSDGTSRNIYLPAPSTLQASYQYGASAVSYAKGGAETCSNISCHLGTSPVWGATSACASCHGYPPVTTAGDSDNKHVAGATPVNHIGSGATVNSKASFVSAHGGCQICHGTQDSGTGAQAAHANYNVATQHNTGNINMNGPVGTGVGYNTTDRGCNAACHANDAAHRMTASAKTLTFGNYGTGGDCLSCHTVAQTSPVAQALNAAVTSRVAIVPSFSLASRHIRSRTASPAVTNNDCCVCHMEGDTATGSPNGTYHKNGYIELRDPDTGLTIKGVTHSGTTATAGAYTSTATDARPVRFSRNLNSATIEADTAAIMVNQCLKCHDANGALSASAIVPGGAALKPFAGTVAANPGGGVLDIATQFASTNRSFHPVLVRQNSGYTNTGGTRMVAPWNGVTKSASTTVYGPLISCWDCHAPNGTASTVTLTTSGIHGGAVSGADVVPLRGNVYVNGATTATNLCLYCHVVSGGTTNHGTGSAITSSTNGSMTYFQNRCYFCHSSVDTNAHAARPRGAGDAHGYNANADGTAISTAGRGYAFIRRPGLPQIVKSVGGTTYTPTCGSATGICSRSMGGYTPGGVY